jgi:hypothetical protein
VAIWTFPEFPTKLHSTGVTGANVYRTDTRMGRPGADEVSPGVLLKQI